MSFVETWVGTPLATALGWALLHSLWEGAMVAAALAAVRGATRSPRARYWAACVALIAMLAGFGITLVCIAPAGGHGPRTFAAPPFPSWNVRPGPGDGGNAFAGVAAMIPWLAPLWIAGVWIFYLRHVAAGCGPGGCGGGACASRPSAGKRPWPACANGCASRGRSC